MNINITNTNWTEVQGLTDDKTYYLQAKYVGRFVINETPILFTQASEMPEDKKEGLLVSDVKFTKQSGKKLYIRAISTPINVQVEEI